MNDDMIATLAQEIAAKVLKRPNRKIKPDEALITSGLIPSMDLVELAIVVEDLYGVHIDDTELTPDVFDTLEQLAELVQSRR